MVMQDWTLAVIAIPIVFILGFAGSSFPPSIKLCFPKWDFSKSPVYLTLAGFAAGTVVAVGFVHSFPEGSEGVASLGVYPFGGLFALLGALATFLSESLVSMYLHRVKSRFGHSDGHSITGHSITDFHIDTEDPEESEDKTKTSKEHHHHQHHTFEDKTKFYTEMIVLLFGLCFHSIFVGFALGLSGNDIGLFLAILCHQFFEGVALGIRIARIEFSRGVIIFIIDFIFSISTPVGIDLGLWIRTAVANNPTTYETVQGFFNTFSAGILIYVGLVHLLGEEVERSRGNVFQFTFLILGVILGAAFMSILAIWA